MSLALFVQQDIESYTKILSQLDKNTKVIQKILQNDVNAANPLVVDKELVSYYQLLLKNGNYLLNQTKYLQDLISKLTLYFKQLLVSTPSTNGKQLSTIEIDTSQARAYEQKIEEALKDYFKAMDQVIQLEGSFLKEESYALSYVEAYNSLSKKISSTEFVSKSQSFQKNLSVAIVQITQQELQNPSISFTNLSKFCQIMEWGVDFFFSEINPEKEQEIFLCSIPNLLFSNIDQLKEEKREFFISIITKNKIDGFEKKKDDGDNLNKLIKCFSSDIKEKEQNDLKEKQFEQELKGFIQKYSGYKGAQNFYIGYNLEVISTKYLGKYSQDQRILILKYLTSLFDNLINIVKNNQNEIQFTSIKTNQLSLFLVDHFSNIFSQDWTEENIIQRGEQDATIYAKQFFKSEIAKAKQTVFPK